MITFFRERMRRKKDSFCRVDLLFRHGHPPYDLLQQDTDRVHTASEIMAQCHRGITRKNIKIDFQFCTSLQNDRQGS